MNLFNRGIVSLRNKEAGRRAVILGNGPSIRGHDLSRLQGSVVVGMNASTMLETEYGFVQDYYVVSDKRFLTHPEKREWATTRLTPSTIRVLRKDIRTDDDSSIANQTYYTPHIKRDGWSDDLGIGFYYGCTTTLLAIQLAAFLGCRQIYVLGVDLIYSSETPRFYSEVSPQLEDSFTSVQIWNIANAREVLQKNDVHLFNCSKNSLLRPYLPYVEFDEVFKKNDLT